MSDQADQPDHATRPGAGQDAQGVDLTLIDWMLSLTPRERLLFVQEQADAITKMRHAAGLPELDEDDQP